MYATKTSPEHSGCSLSRLYWTVLSLCEMSKIANSGIQGKLLKRVC